MAEHRASQAAVPLIAASSARSTGQPRVGGIGLPFSTLSSNLGGFVEMFEASAFDAQKRDGFRDVELKYAHVPPMLLATTNAGTLRFEATQGALLFTADLPESLVYITELISRGDVRGASVGFIALETAWSTTGSKNLRVIIRAELHELSLVSRPAYPTSVALRQVDRRISRRVALPKTEALQRQLRARMAR